MGEPVKITPLQANQALLDAGGNFPAAAAALGIETNKLHTFVSRDAALSKRWIEQPKAPAPSSMMHRNGDVAIAEAIQREEQRLKEGVEQLGLSDRAKSIALACQRFQRNNFNSVLQITSGGITKAFLEALEEIENINQKLANITESVPPEQVVAYECLLREDRSRLMDFVHKAAVKVDQSILMQAKIQKMLGSGGGSGGSEKPGFKPLKRAHVVEQTN